MSPFIGFCKDLSEHPPLACTFTFAWLEGPMAARLCSLAEEHDWKTWPAGRLFGEEGEYRWQRTATGHIHAVLLMDKGEPPDWCIGERVPLEIVTECSPRILWGEPDSSRPGRWYAPELPRHQTYPLEMQEEASPCLFIRRYRAENLGYFERCLAVALLKDEEKTCRP